MINDMKTYKNVPDMERIFSHIIELTSLEHRRTGTENNDKSAEYIRSQFESFGLEQAVTEQYEALIYAPQQWQLRIDGEDIPCYFINYTNYNGKEGIKEADIRDAEVVYMDDGTEADFAGIDVTGKIVMANVKWSDYTIAFYEENHSNGTSIWYDPDDTITDREMSMGKNSYDPYTWPMNYINAMVRGAVGFIGIMSDNCNHYIHYNENYDEFMERDGNLPEDAHMEIPGVWISRTQGEEIVKMLEGGSKKADLYMRTAMEKSHANVVSAVLPGKSEEIILVHSHHDSCFTGAVQDASGMSVVLALAEFFAGTDREEREKTIVFAATDSHFSGYVGHKSFIQKMKDHRWNVIADFVVEHLGKEAYEDRTQKEEMVFRNEAAIRLAYVTDNPRLVNMVAECVEAYDLRRTLILPARKGVGQVCSDGFQFWCEGIPVISFMAPVIYLMDQMDTPDAVAEDLLVPVTKAYADMIDQVMLMKSEEIREGI